MGFGTKVNANNDSDSVYETASAQESFSWIEAEPVLSEVTVPPSSVSSTALPISSPPDSFNTLDLLDDTSTAGYSSSSDSESPRTRRFEETWHDVPTQAEHMYMLFGDIDPLGNSSDDDDDTAVGFTHDDDFTLPPSSIYTHNYDLTTLPSESVFLTHTPHRSRKLSRSSQCNLLTARDHERVTLPLSRDMFVIVVIGVMFACVSVLVVRPVTVAWTIHEDYYYD